MIRGTTLIAAKSSPSTRCQHTGCPITQATRQRILGSPRSPCPRRPICCSAFRPTLSTGDSLWMRLQRYFRLNGFL